MRIEAIDVCASVLPECQSRLHALGYREAFGPLEPGLYTYYVCDVAPGWQESIYALCVAMREGDVLREILEGV